MEIYDYDIYHILREINACIDKKLYYVALTTALTLPDICSKLESKEEKVKKRYVKWCNTYLFEYLPPVDNWLIQKTDWGNIIYQLRCGILHNAENDVEMQADKYKGFKVDRFQFYIDDNEECYAHSMKMHVYENRCTGYTEKKVEIDVNMRFMAFILVQGTLKFIQANKIDEEKFPSVKINMLNTY